MELSSKKTIAKNTLLLYSRTIVLLLVSLYTSRIVLQVLGITDYGVYIAIAGVVTMMTMITGPFSNAISRFITYELGRGNQASVNNVFSTSFWVLLIFALIILVILETIGLWFVDTKLNSASCTLATVNWVYEFALLSFLLQLITIPYTSVVIAHERMNFFAFIGVLDSVLKLIVAVLLYKSPIDKLIYYSALLSLESAIVFLVTMLYCRNNFKECKQVIFKIDKLLFRSIFSYTGWHFFGGAASTLHIQGTNILLNIFGGPLVNTAQGIANQVNGAVTNFVSNFTTAINPSIIKSYASGNKEYFFNLIEQGAKYSYFLLLFFVLPILLKTRLLIELWLGTCPDHTVNFVRLVILYTLFESISKPIMTAINATGKVKWYQIIVGGLLILNLPLSYIALELGFCVESTAFIALMLCLIALFARLIICKRIIGLKLTDFFNTVLSSILKVTILASILPFVISQLLEDNIYTLFCVTIVSVICTLISIFLVGCTREERQVVILKVKKIISASKKESN